MKTNNKNKKPGKFKEIAARPLPERNSGKLFPQISLEVYTVIFFLPYPNFELANQKPCLLS